MFKPLFLSFTVSAALCYGQLSRSTNAPDLHVPKSQNAEAPFQQQGLIICEPSTFFGNDAEGKLYQFALNGTVVSTPTISSIGVGSSIAFCANLHSTSPSPVLYAGPPYFASFYDGNAWQSTNITNFLNAGGNSIYLYSIVDQMKFKVVRHNGSQLQTIYDSFKYQGVADLAVDQAGNVYFVTSADDNISFMTDSIYVMSPTGQLLHQFPFVINYLHAYGSFFKNGVYYIGIGPSNPVYPSTLLPITIGQTVTIGTPIPMPNLKLYDLANCASISDPVAISTAEAEIPELSNPLREDFKLIFNSPDEKTIEVVDYCGKQIIKENFRSIFILQKEKLRSGLYLVRISNRDGSAPAIRRLIVE